MPDAVKNIVLLGATGSIGRQTLDVVRRLPHRFRVVGLAAHRNVKLLAEQAAEFGVRHVAVLDSSVHESLRNTVPVGCQVHSGIGGLDAVCTLEDADIVIVAVSGAAGIRPTHAAIRAGKTVALATKEVLVAAGAHTMALAREFGVPIVPIDSEHSAIFQCLQGHAQSEVDRLYLTASGGPFRETPASDLQTATPEQALKHPTWNMGGLVTINSATLMNKGLEIIEAYWLFGVPHDRIEVVIHPQSIVHSLVRFRDGSTLAQLGLPDMRLPIQYALTYPEHAASGLPMLNPLECGALTFEPPDHARFPAIDIAREALKTGGTMPAVMNAANEVAVELFLKRALSFPGIMELVQAVMEEHTPGDAELNAVLVADAWARRRASELAAYQFGGA